MPKSSPKQTCDKKNEETNVERWVGILQITSIILVQKLISFAYKSTNFEEIFWIEFQRCYGDWTLFGHVKQPLALIRMILKLAHGEVE